MKIKRYILNNMNYPCILKIHRLNKVPVMVLYLFNMKY